MDKILNQLDEFFKTQKESEQKLLFFLPILLFGFLSYYFIYPITDSSLKNAKNKHTQLINKIESIKQTNLRLASHNVRIKKILKLAAVKLKTLNEEKLEADTLVNKLKFLKFDLEKWGNIYNDIPTTAKNDNLTIIQLDNNLKLPNDKKLIQKNMVISIKVVGDFVNFIKFIHYFESKKELIKVQSILMKKHNMDLNISIYGAKL